MRSGRRRVGPAPHRTGSAAGARTSAAARRASAELPTSYEGRTSYELQASALLTDWGTLLGGCAAHTVAYGDFDGDGDEDTFVAEVSVEEGPHGGLSKDPVPVHMFLNEGPAGFRLADEIFRGPVPRIVHPRKALPGDFNGDGRLDIFVAATGY